MSELILAYCIENQYVAAKIESALSGKIAVEKVGIDINHGTARLDEIAAEGSQRVLMLLSDNFLKSENYMFEALKVIQKLGDANRLIPVTTDGIVNQDGKVFSVPTSFDRVSHVIQYMNYWQDYYLNVRKIPNNDEQIRRVRAISSEVGEMLRYIRTMDYFSYDQFEDSNFIVLYRVLGLRHSAETTVDKQLLHVVEAENTPAYVSENSEKFYENGQNSHSEVLESPKVFEEKPDLQPSIDEPEIQNLATLEDTPILEEKIESTIEEPVIDTDPEWLSAESLSSKAAESYKPEPIPEPEILKPNLPIQSITARETHEPILESFMKQTPDKNVQTPAMDMTIEALIASIKSENYVIKEVEKPADLIENLSMNDSEITDKIVEQFQEMEKPKPITVPEPQMVESLKSDIKILEKEDAAHLEPTLEAETEEIPAPKALETETVSKMNLLVEEDDATQVQAEAEDEETNVKAEVERIFSEKLNAETAEMELEEGIDDELRYKYAERLVQSGKLEQAANQLELLLDNNRQHVDAYVLLAYLAEESQDFLLSLSCLEKVTLLNPKYPGIYYKLGMLVSEHFKNQEKKAHKYFIQALELEPNNPEVLFEISKIEASNGKNPELLLTYLEKLNTIKPENTEAAFMLADFYRESGDQEKANFVYKETANRVPSFSTPENEALFFYEQPVQAVPEPEEMPLTEAEILKNKNGHKLVLITGATSGIGRAAAEIFAQNGYKIIVTGRRADRLEALKAQFENDFQAKIQTLCFDVRRLDAVKAQIESLGEGWQNIDILINNAGLARGLEPIHEGKVDDWEEMIDTNIKGLLYMTRAIAPEMVKRRSGHILNICSTAGKEVYPNGNVYAATKHAVDALTRGMRLDLFKHNIRVSQVAPAMVEETEFSLVRFDGDAEKAKVYEDFRPLKASDVAEMIFYIVSRPEYVNIQDVVMMGSQQANSVFIDRSGR
jgi:NADP-dependent 3-hydroxy acid dehydrogenase YdfG